MLKGIKGWERESGKMKCIKTSIKHYSNSELASFPNFSYFFLSLSFLLVFNSDRNHIQLCAMHVPRSKAILAFFAESLSKVLRSEREGRRENVNNRSVLCSHHGKKPTKE